MSRGAECVATGHYAQTREKEGEQRLYAGVDPQKDQSYFLWRVPQELLARTLFPVGALEKSQVRELAQRFELPNAARPDRQGLCVLGDVPLEELLRERLELRDGDVLDEQGAVVGKHRGAALYTIGERHGFTLFASVPHTAPHFVVRKDITHNTITVSETRTSSVLPNTFSLKETNWIGTVADGPCLARYRHRQTLIPATLEQGRNLVRFDEPQAAAAGQSLVLYTSEAGSGSDTRCLGGGVISVTR